MIGNLEPLAGVHRKAEAETDPSGGRWSRDGRARRRENGAPDNRRVHKATTTTYSQLESVLKLVQAGQRHGLTSAGSNVVGAALILGLAEVVLSTTSSTVSTSSSL